MFTSSKATQKIFDSVGHPWFFMWYLTRSEVIALGPLLDIGRNVYGEWQEGAAYNWSFTNECVEILVHSFSFSYLVLIFDDKMK